MRKVRPGTMKVPVSARALYARVQRRLATKGECLKRCREDARAFREIGSLYVVDLNSNYIVDKHCDLESLARRAGVLADWEVLAADDGRA